MRPVFIYSILASLALCLAFCARELPAVADTSELPWLNLHDSVGYVGMGTCRSCHADIHATFVHTGMGRSLGLAHPSRSDARFGPHALVYDTTQNLYYFPFFADSILYIREFRLDETGDTVHQRTERIDYIVGSGHHTNSHLLNRNGYLYQAPITYYTQDGRWDLAPGFREYNERFERWLTAECITCHNHLPTLAAGSLHKYTHMPTGIECERCHGPGELHVRQKLAGIIVDTAAGPDYTIVNPRRLPRDRQMDLCQRCHLQGLAVLEPGKSFFDFRPGMRLSDVMNVYLPRFTNSHEKFIMASQADRLRQSPCYLQSETLTCITCHNPHQRVQTQGSAHFNQSCIGCHAPAAGQLSACTAPPAELQAAQLNCVGCHMPPSGSIDIPHVNITDHYISRDNIRGRPRKGMPTNENPAFLGLQLLTKDVASPLDMARAYVALFDKYAPERYVLDSAAWYLAQLTNPQDPLVRQTQIHYHFARLDYAAVAGLIGSGTPQSETDAWTAYRIGESLFRLGRTAAALPWLERATALLPFHLDFQEKKGMIQLTLQQLAAAERTLQGVLDEDERRPVAHLNLGFLAALQGRYPLAAQHYDRALALNPDYEQALVNKAAILLLQQKTAEARQLLQRALQLNPANAQAAQVLASLAAG